MLNSVDFIKEACSDSGFILVALIVGAGKRRWGIALNVAIQAHIAKDLALSFSWSESKGADCSRESEEHYEQDLGIRG